VVEVVLEGGAGRICECVLVPGYCCPWLVFWATVEEPSRTSRFPVNFST